jgi:hypothetical protein
VLVPGIHPAGFPILTEDEPRSLRSGYHYVLGVVMVLSAGKS